MATLDSDPRWDAQTLAEAEVIKSNPARLSAAQGAAAQLANQKREEATAMNKVAKKKTNGSTSRRTANDSTFLPKLGGSYE